MSSDIKEILRCTVLSERDSTFNLLSASFPINIRLISFAHGSISCSAIVCGFLALAIRNDITKVASTEARFRYWKTPELFIRDRFTQFAFRSKNDKSLSLQSVCFVSKCLLSFDGFMDSGERTFMHNTHCGFSMSSETILTNPYLRNESE